MNMYDNMYCVLIFSSFLRIIDINEVSPVLVIIPFFIL